MEHILAEVGLQLIYLHDPHEIAAIDQGTVLEDLADGGVDDDALPWHGGFNLADKDFVVLAMRISDGRHVGLLCGRDLATAREPFTLLDTACVAPMAPGLKLVQRMIAFAMLCAARRDMAPRVIAVCGETPDGRRGLDALHRQLTAASRFPTEDDVVVDLGMAALARRIARVARPGIQYAAGSGSFRATTPVAGVAAMGGGVRFDRSAGQPRQTLVVLDLSACDDIAILDGARRQLRARMRRGGGRPEIVTDLVAEPRFVPRPAHGATTL